MEFYELCGRFPHCVTMTSKCDRIFDLVWHQSVALWVALSGIEWHSRLMLYNLILCVLLIVRLINFVESWPNYQSDVRPARMLSLTDLSGA